MTRMVCEAVSAVGLIFVCATAAAGDQRTTQQRSGPGSPQRPSGPDGTRPAPEVDPPGDAAAASDADEELQQLITQAEALTGTESPADAETIALIAEELEGLKAALATKASQLASGQDTTEADLEVASRRETLQAAIAGVTDQDSSADSPAAVETADTDRSSLAATIASYVGDALELLSKIRELLDIDRDERTDSAPPSGTGASEESLPSVTGVVTDSGKPLEGVSVTDPESGVTAVTNADGQYTLEGLPAGRPAGLKISKDGASIGDGRIDLAPGHDGVGDFELRQAGGRSRPSMRVLPSVVVAGGASRTGNTGSLRGTLRDAAGRPIIRALIVLDRRTRARTDSKGQYAFLRVPPGTYDLKVFRIGLPPESRRVRVTASRTDGTLTLAARPGRRRTGARALIRRGSNTGLNGVVAGVGGSPIRAAKVALIRDGRAVFVKTDARGGFRFVDVVPGRYRVLVSKPGYHPVGEAVSLEPGTGPVRNFQLTSTAAAVRTASTARASHDARATVRIGAPAAGRVVGRVFDATTRKPIAGAVVMVNGHAAVGTNRAGIYRVLGVVPSRHHVVVKTNGYETLERYVHVGRGRVVRLDVALSPTSSPRNRRPPDGVIHRAR